MLAQEEARLLDHNYIGTEHMLLGLVREGEGVAAQVLVELGADLPRVRERVVEVLSGGDVVNDEPAPPPEPPLCHWCRAPLAQMTGYRVVEAAGPEGSEAVRIVVAYCQQCDRAVGVVGRAEDDGSGPGREDA